MNEQPQWYGLSEDELIALIVALVVIVVMVFYFIRTNGTADSLALSSATPAAEVAAAITSTVAPTGDDTVAGRALTPEALVPTPASTPAPVLAGVEMATNAPTLELPGTRYLFGAVLLEGSADPDSQVDVQVDGRTLGATRAGADGRWSYTLGTGSLAPGERTIVAIGRGDGQLLPSLPQQIVMEAPEAPIFGGSYDGLTRTPGRYTIRGQASPNWRVLVQVNEWPPQLVSTDSGGNWATELLFERPDTYAVTAFAVDMDNNPIPTRKTQTALVTIAPATADTPPPLIAEPVVVTPTVVAGVVPTATATPLVDAEPSPTVEPPAVITPTLAAPAPTEAAGEPVITPTIAATPAVTATVPADTQPPDTAPASEAPPADATAAPADTLLAVLQNAGNYATLLAALETAGLTEALANPTQSLTLFAPTDAAFAALPSGAVEAYLRQPDQLRLLLEQHLVADNLGAADLAALRENGTAAVATLAGGVLPIGDVDGTLNVAGAQLEQLDLRTAGGTVHGINRVLLPPGPIVSPTIDAEGVPTFEGRYLTVVGTGTPGSILQLESNGEPFGTTVVAADGRWAVANDIEPGEYTLIAYAYETGGLLRAASQPILLRVR